MTTEHEHVGEAGPAVLDLGAEVGAAVIYTTAALDQAELEIRPVGGVWDGTHTAVRKRPGPVHAALFFGLREGEYDVRVRGTEPVLSVRIVGGHVTEDVMP